MINERDTIFALSSGRPPAAIAVIRVSGPRAGAALAGAGTPRAAIEREAWSSLAKVMLISNEFLYVE